MARRAVGAAALAVLTTLAFGAPAFGQEEGEPTEQATAAPTETATEAGEATEEPSTAPQQCDGEIEVVEDEVQILETDTSAFPEVRLLASVPPAFAGDLSEASFALNEADQRRLINVAKLRERIEVVVVIDTSGSMAGAPISSAQAAARSFLEQLAPEADVAVIGFGETVTVYSRFADGRAAATAAIDQLQADGETALFDALVAATEEFGSGNARRFLVVLSDGADTVNPDADGDATKAITDVAANLYAVTLESADADFTKLNAIADATGGSVVSAADSAELEVVYEALAARLSNVYEIDFTAQVGGDAELKLSVHDPNRCIVAYATAVGDFPEVSDPEYGGEPDDPAPTELPFTPVEVEAPVATVSGGPSSPLARPEALYAGAGALFLAIGFLLFQVLGAEPARPSAFKRLDFKNAVPRRSGLASFADRAAGATDRMLEQRSQRSKLDSKLEQAGFDMRPGEYVLASAGACMGVAATGFVLFGIRGALGGAVLGVLGARFKLNRGVKKRKKRFGNQLGDTLLMMAGSLRAGHGVVEAIDTVSAQGLSPTGEEFSRVVAETRIGRDLTEALYDVASRTGSEDFVWVVRAIAINRELGGDLAEVLDNVGETIRDRNRLRDQVRALSAEGRVSAYILFGLPILVALWVRMSNPEYMASMTGHTPGKIVFGTAGFLMVIGGLWLKKLVNVQY